MKRRFLPLLLSVLLFPALLSPLPVRADSVTDTIGIYVGYYGWPESDYKEKVTYHWSELDDWYGGALDTQEVAYSYYNGSRTYLVAARGFYIRDLLQYAGIDFGSIASVDFFTKDHANGAYRSFSKASLFDLPRYYFPNLAASEDTGEIYAYDGDDIWNGATTVEAMLALEDYTEWDTVGSEFEQLYDPAMRSPNSRFHLFFGQAQPAEASTSSAAKYCYKILVTFSGTPRLSTEETDLSLKIGSGRKIEVDVDAEDGLLNNYVRENITWTSSDENIVSVAPDGTVSVHAAGDAVVTASFGNTSVSVHIAVGDDAETIPEAAATGEGDGGSGDGTGTGEGESGGAMPEGAGRVYIPGAVNTQDDPPAATAPPAAAPVSTPEPVAEPTPESVVEAAPEPEPAPLPEPTPEPEPEPEDSAAGAEIDLAPAAEPEPVRELSGKQVFTVSPKALLGMLPGSAVPEDQSGGRMDDDSVQLVLTEPERTDYTAYIAASLAGAFLLGFGFEIFRFRRILKR